ncbi:carbohydrate esterase family 15 protein [Sphaerobolus stellatus SS14]|nr:carbohydrate esterase family 15 protein [Sphaerobolus stellatus SS14]
MAIKHILLLIILAIPAFAQQQEWGQCGGIGWAGPTTCVSGTSCIKHNDYFSECLAPSSSTATGTQPTGGNCLTLKLDAKLPDPFTFFANGTCVASQADWACRRAEISQLFQRYELGTLPSKPQTVTGTLSGTALTINVSDSAKIISLAPTITYPSIGSAPFPAIIAIGGLSIPTPAGVAVINFNNDDMAIQNDATSRGLGVGRIIDALEGISSNSRIDLTRLGVSGCSHNGKGALVAGAFETQSGSSYAGYWRISDKMLASGISTQTASEIVGENVWFSTAFAQYVNQVSGVILLE